MKPHLNESFGSMRSKSSPSWLRIGGWSPVSTPSENVQPTRKLASTFLPWADSGAVIKTTSANATSPVTFLNMIDLHAWVTTPRGIQRQTCDTCALAVARRTFGVWVYCPHAEMPRTRRSDSTDPMLSVSSLTRGAMHGCASFLPVKENLSSRERPANSRGRGWFGAGRRFEPIVVETERSTDVKCGL